MGKTEEHNNKLKRDHNYSIVEIQAGIDKLDERTQEFIYSCFKMSDIKNCMNSEAAYSEISKSLADIVEQYLFISSGLAKLKKWLEKGNERYTPEELKSYFIQAYQNLPEERQSDICNELRLVRSEDIPEPKEEPVTMDKILKAYDEMSDDEKVFMDMETRNRDSHDLSVKKFIAILKDMTKNTK